MRTLDEMTVDMEEAIDGIRHQQGEQELARMQCNLGIAYMHTGRMAEATEMLAQAEAVTIHSPRIAIERDELRGRILIREGALPKAKAVLESARALAEQHDLHREQIDMIELLQHIASEERDFDAYKQYTEALISRNDALRGTRVTQRVRALDQERQREIESVERDRERSILYRTLPQEIAAKAVRGEDVSGELHEHAAVLFLDTVNFTSHAMQMDPKELTRFLGVVFRHFDAICARHNVTKIKTIGDAYLAVAFDGAQSSEQRAASAAVEMIASTFYWPLEDSPEGSLVDSREAVTFRIGLHSGPVVAGVIGTDRLQYDVWGDTVNTASRMESTGEPGKVQCSESFERFFASAQNDVTARHPEERSDEGPLFSFTRRGSIDIKGKGTMTTYWLEGAPPT